MKRNHVLDYKMYEWILKSINQMSLYEDKLGVESEFNFLRSNEWLGDTAVIERLIYRKGQFRIDLVFAHHQQPLKLLIRNITEHSSRKKAEFSPNYSGDKQQRIKGGQSRSRKES